MWLGLDIGTSAAKAVLLDDADRVVAQASAPVPISRPRPLWSEQDPQAWWTAGVAAISGLPVRGRATVRGVGLSGQMHGAVALDGEGRTLRPAILWNDGRSQAQCAELERIEPATRAITGNAAMPGFTAPKLLWMREHEPELFAQVRTVLLPKDYVRLRLTGECVSDPSDAAGTLWLDVGERRWSPAMLAACGLDERRMPRLVEGSQVSGRLTAGAARLLGLPRVPVAGGGGDNAAGAIGAGVVEPGDAFLSLGTSGVVFAVSDGFRPGPSRGLHAFCHALPGRWHQMAVILSAAACLDWAARTCGYQDVPAALADAEQADDAHVPTFLPYLSGERTPHDDPHASGVLFGLTHDTGRAEIVRAVQEGVAFALADGLDAVRAAGTDPAALVAIGGGARSRGWGGILATTLDRSLEYRADGEVGPALGAARLARLAVTGEPFDAVCAKRALLDAIEPDRALADRLAPRLALFRRLYPDLRDAFRNPHA